eukprot:symbB.v1.2.019937.t1/scaffold1645.1/size107836/2
MEKTKFTSTARHCGPEDRSAGCSALRGESGSARSSSLPPKQGSTGIFIKDTSSTFTIFQRDQARFGNIFNARHALQKFSEAGQREPPKTGGMVGCFFEMVEGMRQSPSHAC